MIGIAERFSNCNGSALPRRESVLTCEYMVKTFLGSVLERYEPELVSAAPEIAKPASR
jgi:hypothetical protein